jgi:hypothetical protein
VKILEFRGSGILREVQRRPQCNEGLDAAKEKMTCRHERLAAWGKRKEVHRTAGIAATYTTWLRSSPTNGEHAAILLRTPTLRRSPLDELSLAIDDGGIQGSAVAVAKP